MKTMKKILTLISLIILIPTITNAKLNEIKFVNEKTIKGEITRMEDLFLFKDKNQLTTVDLFGNKINTSQIEGNVIVSYNYLNETLEFYNPETGNMTIKDKNLNTIVNKTILPRLTPTQYQRGYYIYCNNDRTEIYIYDDKLNLIKTTSNRYEKVFVSKNNLSIITTKDNKTHIIKTYDRKDNLVYEKELAPIDAIITVYFFEDGNFIVLNKDTSTATLYDGQTGNIIKTIEEMTIYNSEIYGNYLYNIDKETKDKITNLETTISEREMMTIKQYDSSLNLIGTITINEYNEISKKYLYENFADNVFNPIYTAKISEVIEKAENISYANVIDVIKYRDEYYALYGGEQNYKLYHISKDLKEIETMDIKFNKTPEGYRIVPKRISVQGNSITIIIELGIIEPGDEMIPQLNENLKLYIFRTYKINGEPYKIKTKINGKGNIDVLTSSQPNERVNIKINPEEGYALANIYMIDSKGKKQKLTDEFFIMPESDITIEAEFSTINPETDTNISYFIIAFISFIIIMILQSKISTVKRYEN